MPEQLLEALERVPYRDLPENDPADALDDRLRMMAGIPSEEILEPDTL